MKLREAIYDAALLLQLDELTEAMKNGEESEASGEAEDQLFRLVKCANLVIGEIAADYVQLKTVETVRTDENGEVGYSALARRIIDVYGARDERGRRARAECRAQAIKFPRPGEYELTYSYAPEEAELGDDIPYTDRVSARLIANGVAAEYCIMTGASDDAVLFDKRYRDGLHAAAIVKAERRMPARRWL